MFCPVPQPISDCFCAKFLGFKWLDTMGSLSRDDGFLPSLTRAFKSLDAQAQVNTRAFVEAVEAILPVFDDLGEHPKPSRCLC